MVLKLSGLQCTKIKSLAGEAKKKKENLLPNDSNYIQYIIKTVALIRSQFNHVGQSQ